MDKPSQHIEFIEAYLNGKKTRQEILEIGVFASEEEFDRQLEAVKIAGEAIFETGLSESIKDIHKELYAEKTAFWTLRRMGVAIAASCALILSCYLIFKESPYPQADFDEYFVPYPSTKGFRNPESNSVDLAFSLYAQGKLDSAELVFNNTRIDTVNYAWNFYKANTHLALGHFNEAIKSLEPIKGKEENLYWQQTNWYLCLAYWQVGDLEKSITMLRAIKEDEFRYTEAQELIRLLE